MLFGKYDDDFEAVPEITQSMIESVYERLPKPGLIQFAEIAEALDAVPWDVLKVCRELVRSQRAREGNGKEKGFFGRT